MHKLTLALCLFVASVAAQAQHNHQAAAAPAENKIYGEYVESRSADIFTGPCFANGEESLTGDQALLGWRVQRGTWKGVQLDGLGVVAAVKASFTLGSNYGDPYPAKAMLIFDEKATSEQQAALRDFAQSMAGKLLENIVRTAVAPITLDLEYQGEHAVSAQLKAGNLASIRTRMISSKDHLCGNEDTFYQPLTATAHAMPAVALLDEFKGGGIGVSWMTRDKRSAFVGNFAQ